MCLKKYVTERKLHSEKACESFLKVRDAKLFFIAHAQQMLFRIDNHCVTIKISTLQFSFSFQDTLLSRQVRLRELF